MRETKSERSAGAAFRYANFRFFLFARFLTIGSSEMQAVAVGWQIYAMTHRPLDLGLVGLAQFLPGVLLFLVSGHTADRVPRRRILRVCYGAFSICSLLLAVFSLRGVTSVYPLYLVLLLNGTVRAFNHPASQALLPLLVPQEHFPNAVAWGASFFQAASIVGPMAGGALYGLTGSPVPVYLGAASAYITSLILISAVRMPDPARRTAQASLNMVLEGLNYIRRSKLILGALSLDMFAVLLGGAVALLPVYARDILKTSASGLGLLRSAPGIGAVLTAVIVARWPLQRRVGAKMLWCVFGFGLFTVAFGLSRSLPISLACLALAGSCDMVSVIVRQTLVQLATPDQMRGRVSAVNGVFISASNEVGQFESGVTAQWFGAVPAVLLGGIGTMLIVLLWARIFPELRRRDELS
jgi:MFS family permease